ncbi:MAG: RNA methyltransferase [Verrucomicrobia bacterium]|nr:RNA methyltransferase [Verrucomicrobiota bacterium]
MLHVHSIESIDLPELAPYRTLRRQAEHRCQGIFVAEGEKVVRRLLESRFPVVSLLLQDEWFPVFEPLLHKRPEEIRAYVTTKAQLEKLTGYPLFQGILAVGKIPPPASLEQILQTCGRPWLLVAVEGITNAHNMGVVTRNCAAFGAHAMVMGETACSPFLRRAVRNSMGAIFQLPVVETDCLVGMLHGLRARQVRCIAAHPHAANLALPQCDFTKDICLVFGSEGHGLLPETLSACDETAAIPMSGQVDSLNVGSAAAAFLYEVGRQRGRFC